MKDQNCAYCMREENPSLYQKFAYPVCQMTSGYLYLFKEQSKKGRVVLAYKEHVGEMGEISSEERKVFFDDVAKVASVIHELFHPDKVNYGMYGDTGHHMHMHIVPKYKGGDEWGGTFQMNPDKVFLTDAEYEKMAQQIRDALAK